MSRSPFLTLHQPNLVAFYDKRGIGPKKIINRKAGFNFFKIVAALIFGKKIEEIKLHGCKM